MKELLELRVNVEYADLLFGKEEGKKVGTSVKVVLLDKDDPRYARLSEISEYVAREYSDWFFLGWQIRRIYSKKELDSAGLLHLQILRSFEPSGEQCGTQFDETTACKICGSNRRQVGILHLLEKSIPKLDISRTIGGEVVVSSKLASMFESQGLSGAAFLPIQTEKGISTYKQLRILSEVSLSERLVAGVNPIDLSDHSDAEVYKCPLGHTIGLNLLSEPWVSKMEGLNVDDLLMSKQKIGVHRGLLRPAPIYFCSQAFRKMAVDGNLKGIGFEVVREGW
jgi:hypothetical protein